MKTVVVTGHFVELTDQERLDEQPQALYWAAQGPLRFALADGDIYREPEAAILWKVIIEETTGRVEKWDFSQGFRYW